MRATLIRKFILPAWLRRTLTPGLAVSWLFASVPVVCAQMNDLSATERANVQEAIANLKDLVAKAAKLPDKDKDPQLIDKYKKIADNMQAKLDGKHFKSVPGLSGDKPKKYRPPPRQGRTSARGLLRRGNEDF